MAALAVQTAKAVTTSQNGKLFLDDYLTVKIPSTSNYEVTTTMTATQILLVNLNDEDKQAPAAALIKAGFVVATAVIHPSRIFRVQCWSEGSGRILV